MVQRDESVYATCDVTFDSTLPQPYTQEVLIAEPDTYWRMALDQLGGAIKHRIGGNFPGTGPLHYEKVRASLLPQSCQQQALVARYYNCLVLATDNPHVDLDAVADCAKGIDRNVLGRSLATGLQARPVEAQQRRVELIGRLKCFVAIPQITRLLGQRTADQRTKRLVQTVLISLASDFHSVPLPADVSNYHQWRTWWIKARKQIS